MKDTTPSTSLASYQSYVRYHSYDIIGLLSELFKIPLLGDHWSVIRAIKDTSPRRPLASYQSYIRYQS